MKKNQLQKIYSLQVWSWWTETSETNEASEEARQEGTMKAKQSKGITNIAQVRHRYLK